MITFKTYLQESLDSSYTINKKEWTPFKGTFEFLDDDHSHFIGYVYRAREYSETYEEEVWGAEVAFYQKTATGTTTKVTNNIKNPLKVYSTIGRAVLRYLEEYPVREVEFVAAADRTVDLYVKLGKRLARSLGGKLMMKRDVFKIVMS